jgi:Protein of unknown function (DUF1257)
MSHFTQLRTQITDVDALVRALADVGFNVVEVHETASPLYGFGGDVRPQTAEVVIRRNYIGWGSNDIGFKRLADGTFVAIISEYDRHKYSQQWLDRLTQRYAYRVALAKLTEQGFDLIAEEVREGERIHLLLRRIV